MYIIKYGKVQVINPMGYDKVFTEIGRGDFFGETSILKRPVSLISTNNSVQGIDFCGDVVAVGNEDDLNGKQAVQCYFISHENLFRIPLVEL